MGRLARFFGYNTRVIYAFASVLILMLIASSWVDMREYRLPDTLTLPLIGIGLFQAYTLNLGWRASLIGAIVGYAVFVAVEIGFKALRGKDGLGRGDAKLLAAGGAWCGWAGLPFIVLIASGMGLIALLFPSFRQRSEIGHIPFGPFLALGIALVWTSKQLAIMPFGT